MDFVTPVMEYWLEQEIAQWVHHEGLNQRPITVQSSYISLTPVSLQVKQLPRCPTSNGND